MGPHASTGAGGNDRSRQVAYDGYELWLPREPAGRSARAELVVARQAGEIAPPQSRRGGRVRAIADHAARRRIATALIQARPEAGPLGRGWIEDLAANPDELAQSNPAAERLSHRVAARCFVRSAPYLLAENAVVVTLHRYYRTAAERRGNMLPAALIAAAMSVDRPSSPILTYISIGFLPMLIYAEGEQGSNHSMLFLARVPRSPNWPAFELVTAFAAVVDTRTLATKCCHNVWQRVRGCGNPLWA